MARPRLKWILLPLALASFSALLAQDAPTTPAPLPTPAAPAVPTSPQASPDQAASVPTEPDLKATESAREIVPETPVQQPVATPVLQQFNPIPDSTIRPKKSEKKSAAPVATSSPFEATLKQALAANPAIQQAQAQLREAEARLKQVQMEVSQSVSEAYRQSELEQSQLLAAQQSLEEKRKLAEAGRISSDELLLAQSTLDKLQMNRAALEAKLRALAGVAPGVKSSTAQTSNPAIPEEPLVRVERPKANDSSPLSELLQAPVSLEFEDKTLTAVADMLAEYFSINIVLDEATGQVRIPYIKLNDVALRDALAALADQASSVCFVLRDTYIFGTSRDGAKLINAPSIPSDIPLYLPEYQAQQAEKEPIRR